MAVLVRNYPNACRGVLLPPKWVLTEISDPEAFTSRYVKPVELPSESRVAQIQNGLSVTVVGVDGWHRSQSS